MNGHDERRCDSLVLSICGALYSAFSCDQVSRDMRMMVFRVETFGIIFFSSGMNEYSSIFPSFSLNEKHYLVKSFCSRGQFIK